MPYKWEIDRVEMVSELISDPLLDQKLAIVAGELYSLIYQLRSQSNSNSIIHQNKNENPVNTAGETDSRDGNEENKPDAA